MLKTDFVKIAESGKTLSGKEMTDFMLTAVAENYNRDIYTATISDETTGVNFGLVETLRAVSENGKTSLYAVFFT